MEKLTRVDLTQLPESGIFTVEVPLMTGAFVVLGEEAACPHFPETAKNMLSRSFTRHQRRH